MSTLLYLQASPRVARSHSRKVADAFLAAYQQHHPDDTIMTVDLFQVALPALDGNALQGKYALMQGRDFSAAEAEAWRAVEEVIRPFTDADKYLLAVPMWNFGIPYRLKHYLDLVIQPGYTFSFSSETGYRGLVTGKPVCVVYARGSAYPAGSTAEGLDQQTRYLEQMLRFIGFTEIHSIRVEPTSGAVQELAEQEQAALAQATEWAATF